MLLDEILIVLEFFQILLEFFFDFVGKSSNKKLPEAFLKPLKRSRWTPGFGAWVGVRNLILEPFVNFQIVSPKLFFEKTCLFG